MLYPGRFSEPTFVRPHAKGAAHRSLRRTASALLRTSSGFMSGLTGEDELLHAQTNWARSEGRSKGITEDPNASLRDLVLTRN